jgi:hypothetical protein
MKTLVVFSTDNAEVGVAYTLIFFYGLQANFLVTGFSETPTEYL